MTDLHPAELVHARLEWGQERAMTIAWLAELCRLPVRAVQEGVEELRRRGVPICTGPRGVWLTQDPEEVLDQYRRLRRRALHQLANLRQMQRTAQAMHEPLTLWRPS